MKEEIVGANRCRGWRLWQNVQVQNSTNQFGVEFDNNKGNAASRCKIETQSKVLIVLMSLPLEINELLGFMID